MVSIEEQGLAIIKKYEQLATELIHQFLKGCKIEIIDKEFCFGNMVIYPVEENQVLVFWLAKVVHFSGSWYEPPGDELVEIEPYGNFLNALSKGIALCVEEEIYARIESIAIDEMLAEDKEWQC